MSIRHLILFVIVMVPLCVLAQSDRTPLKPLTLHLLMAQKPPTIAVEDWQKVIANPASASLYPIRLTQTMLDTLDATALDLRWQYVMVEKERPTPVQEQ